MIFGENHRFFSSRKSVHFDIITVHQENDPWFLPQVVFPAVRFELLCHEEAVEPQGALCNNATE